MANNTAPPDERQDHDGSTPTAESVAALARLLRVLDQLPAADDVTEED